MTTLQELTAAEPDLAARAIALLTSTTNAVLATIRADGSPRLSGIDPWLADGELHLGSMPNARKGQDLRRDPRIALHGIPWESRKVREGAPDPGDGDVKITGRAILITDSAAQAAALGTLKDEHGVDPPEPGDTFRVELDSVVVISVVDDQLVIDRWTADGGRQVVRRS